VPSGDVADEAPHRASPSRMSATTDRCGAKEKRTAVPDGRSRFFSRSLRLAAKSSSLSASPKLPPGSLRVYASGAHSRLVTGSCWLPVRSRTWRGRDGRASGCTNSHPGLDLRCGNKCGGRFVARPPRCCSGPEPGTSTTSNASYGRVPMEERRLRRMREGACRPIAGAGLGRCCRSTSAAGPLVTCPNFAGNSDAHPGGVPDTSARDTLCRVSLDEIRGRLHQLVFTARRCRRDPYPGRHQRNGPLPGRAGEPR